MKRLPLLLLLVAVASCDGSDAANGVGGGPGPSKAEEVSDIDMLEFGSFDYVERMELPEKLRRWHGKKVRATGYMNPGRQIRDVKSFELVMNRASCCFGMRPRMNHFFQVMLDGASTVYTSDPVTIEGRFTIEEQYDGDWPIGLYWLKEAKVVK
jgi:hypothetical protein